MHQNSWLIIEKYALKFFTNQCSVLEIGPDADPSTLQRMAGAHVKEWHTLDTASWLANSAWTATYSAKSPYDYPVEDNRYDIVVSAQVIEHVPHPWRWMKELARVTKPGGHVITVNPVTWFYHEAPVDCWRIYPEGMKALSEEAGLNLVLSTWESVEIDNATKWLPDSLRSKKIRFQRMSLLLDLVGRALRSKFRGAFDTITVAEKP